ncbi:16S rRNA (cytosine(967)-C(5))-methyltransferase RsmB [Oceanobacter sp. 4_MG-2023]|uniref:16S rRNA (cytosine(967)-C(5))-methyltransferase RsmB n=1 Tax=Oceanobacter sp. 4_MG-2023 TaxID=3062623 RepID=UPI0027374D06|nr:16S rRNA (cytosine(967)-C(5))-methyltransferase RsmB [Oceanobacter sp. 4_MG-2023]MDP2546918.1 16S rRNA (cytosine(967)-C(5))-methyltransferase RsmB [Oceanobacter sp. 4_MG-2023]
MSRTHPLLSTSTHDPRALAAIGLYLVEGGQSLNTLMPALEGQVEDVDRGFLRDLLLGSCRYYFRLNAIAKILLSNAFNDEQEVLHCLLIVGLYQLEIQHKAAHAAVHATVEACDELGHGQARGVINACLRRYQREQTALAAQLADNPVTATSHPKWLVKMLTKAWPEQWPDILHNNNQLPPLCLRVNRRQGERDAYLQQLQAVGIEACPAPFAPQGIYLSERCDVTTLPGFMEGAVSVQDEAAQLTADLLAPRAGERILDACAAPGGKSCHLLELADIDLTAVDLEPGRMARVEENLARLQLSATLHSADVAETDQWWDGQLFDAILLDAPCSATGVIRRHPDIKLLRRREDIARLAEIQALLLDACWAMLKPGGRLLYATCSVLPQENSQQIETFVQRTTAAGHSDVTLLSLDKPWGSACNAGRQLFPAADSTDGFYMALLRKDIATPSATDHGDSV